MKAFINYLNENKIEPIIKIDGDAKLWVIPNTEYDDLSYFYYGILHREDGPAIEYKDGYKEWHIHGKLHREDGPAIEYVNNEISWFLNDKMILPSEKMMEKYIRLDPENIFRDYKWPKEIQALAIELGGNEIKDRLIKEKKIHPSLVVNGLDKLDNRGFFN